MSGVSHQTVGPDDADSRLDRWFRRYFPDVTHGRLEKMLRKGEIRVDGKRAKSNTRLAPGQEIRIPPLGAPAPRQAPARPSVDAADAEMLQAAVLLRKDDMIALNKPPGLPTQGGSGVTRHLDGMLDALKFDAAERPRLVHRLDKDTSGVLLLARTAAAARSLTEAFRRKTTRKIYWAITAGVPRPHQGTIRLPLGKRRMGGEERMAHDPEGGQTAETRYAVIEALGKDMAWIALMPVTGRTHQLRVHLAEIGAPILGDGKYGGEDAFRQGKGLSRKMHLHARKIVLPGAAGDLQITAPLPDHMDRSFAFLGFDPASADAAEAEAMLIDAEGATR